MTDRDPLHSGAAPDPANRVGPLPPQPRPLDRSFGSPLLFDLTAFQDEEEPSDTPEVYYLAAMVPAARPSSPWPTVVGFGAVILAGVGLGLVLALLLL